MGYIELVKRVIASMEDDKKRFSSESDVQESKLMELTCEPIKITYVKCTGVRSVRDAFIDKIVDFLIKVRYRVLGDGSSNTFLDERDFTAVHVGGGLFSVCLGRDKYLLRNMDQEIIAEVSPIKCNKMKPGRALSKILTHFLKDVILDDEQRRKIEVEKNRVVKEISTMLGDEVTYYVYFTKYDYPQHYEAMREKLDLKSCMSHSSKYYGVIRDETMFENATDCADDYHIHPLEGYHYSPDFRLALFSIYPPEEIVKLDDNVYPFVRRQVTFLYDGVLAYGKGYGVEGSDSIASSYFKVVNSAPKKRFYGIIASGVEQRVVYEIDSYSLNKLHNKMKDDHVRAIVAPYIDPMHNLYDEYGIVTREDGARVVLLITEQDNDDEANTFFVQHNTGILCFNDYCDNTCIVYIRDESVEVDD